MSDAEHEISTPLNSIADSSDLLVDAPPMNQPQGLDLQLDTKSFNGSIQAGEDAADTTNDNDLQQELQQDQAQDDLQIPLNRNRRSWLMTSKFLPDYSPATPRRSDSSIHCKRSRGDGESESSSFIRDHDTVSEIDVTNDFDSRGNARRTSFTKYQQQQYAIKQQRSQKSIISDLSVSNNSPDLSEINVNRAHPNLISPRQVSQKSVVSDLSDEMIIMRTNEPKRPKRGRKRQPPMNNDGKMQQQQQQQQSSPAMPVRRPTLTKSRFPLFQSSRSKRQIAKAQKEYASDEEDESIEAVTTSSELEPSHHGAICVVKGDAQALAKETAVDNPWNDAHEQELPPAMTAAPRMPSRRSTKNSFDRFMESHGGEIEDPSVAPPDKVPSRDGNAPRMPKRKASIVEMISRRFLGVEAAERIEPTLEQRADIEPLGSMAPNSPQRQRSFRKVLRTSFRRTKSTEGRIAASPQGKGVPEQTAAVPRNLRRRTNIAQVLVRSFRRSDIDDNTTVQAVPQLRETSDRTGAPVLPRRQESIAELLPTSFRRGKQAQQGNASPIAGQQKREMREKLQNHRMSHNISHDAPTTKVNEPLSDSDQDKRPLIFSLQEVDDERHGGTGASSQASYSSRLNSLWHQRILPRRENGKFYFRRANAKPQSNDEEEFLVIASVTAFRPKRLRKSKEKCDGDYDSDKVFAKQSIKMSLDTVAEGSTEFSRAMNTVSSSVNLGDLASYNNVESKNGSTANDITLSTVDCSALGVASIGSQKATCQSITKQLPFLPSQK
ncbi:hypothetical protein MPSEU_000623900 [Mayamaea pseudoterrestris]|nr:hypothetical protein MPSEU_000623900 [Mayamaea pseudoterrestris]